MDCSKAAGITKNLSRTQNKVHLKSKDTNDSDSEEYDTDLEENFTEEKDFYKTQEEIYFQTCQNLDIAPVSRFLRELRSESVVCSIMVSEIREPLRFHRHWHET